MNKNFIYVGLIFASLGLSACSNSSNRELMDTSKKYTDEYGSVWEYVNENYPYWLIVNTEHNTTCRYYPFSNVFTTHGEDRDVIEKPAYVSESLAKKTSELTKQPSHRPRTEYHTAYYGGYNTSGFMSGYLMGSILSNSYGGYGRYHTNTIREVHYVPTSNTTYTSAGLKYTPVKPASTFNNRINNTSSAKHGNVSTSSNVSTKTNVATPKNSSVKSSSTKSSSTRSSGFGSTGRSSSSSAAS